MKCNTIFLIILVLIIFYVLFSTPPCMKESMAPVSFGTYNVNRGDTCYENGNLHQNNKCGVGECPLHSSIEDEDFCYINCAQEPIDDDRRECYQDCLNMMSSC